MEHERGEVWVRRSSYLLAGGRPGLGNRGGSSPTSAWALGSDGRGSVVRASESARKLELRERSCGHVGGLVVLSTGREVLTTERARGKVTTRSRVGETLGRVQLRLVSSPFPSY